MGAGGSARTISCQKSTHRLRKRPDSDAKAVLCGDVGTFCFSVYSYAVTGPWLFRRSRHRPPYPEITQTHCLGVSRDIGLVFPLHFPCVEPCKTLLMSGSFVSRAGQKGGGFYVWGGELGGGRSRALLGGSWVSGIWGTCVHSLRCVLFLVACRHKAMYPCYFCERPSSSRLFLSWENLSGMARFLFWAHFLGSEVIFNYDSFRRCEVRNPGFPMSETSHWCKNELLNHFRVPKHPEAPSSSPTQWRWWRYPKILRQIKWVDILKNLVWCRQIGGLG